MPESPAIQLLIDLIQESYRKKAWHGTNLRGSIRGLTCQQAAWRPGPKRHSIWEIVIHCAYWKYIVRRRILGGKKGSFYRKGSNWFAVDRPYNERSWKHDIRMLADCHEGLVEAVASLRASNLRKTPRGSNVSTGAILRGIASHDVYHAGQIQLIKRLMQSTTFSD